MEIELLPCPFCDAESAVYCLDDMIYVKCSNCEARGPEASDETGAAYSWNNRPERMTWIG